MDALSVLLYYLITMPESDLVFLHCGYMPQCVAHVDKHFDGYFTLQYMAGGGIELSYDEREYTLEGHWFWPAYPGPHTRFHPAPGHLFWVHRYVAFKGPLVSRWVAEGLYPDQPLPAPPIENYPRKFDELLEQVQRSTRWGTLRAINLLERILLELAEARARPQEREPWLERVMAELQKPPPHPDLSHKGRGETTDYASIARREGMALSTLRRRFRQATGTALHTYALQCRVGEARRLLGETDFPIKEIAEQLGYSDVYFFSRQFAKMTGTTPAAYRRSRQ
ncbi:MAG TPA: AraC family transcriptional regulator [Planctomycetota bacterium]|nr:AraC family transcriptional regulator [Planctomycetota bacterium]